LTNNTGLPLPVGNITLVSSAFHESHDCQSILSPGEGCNFSVIYSPTQMVPEFTSLQIQSSALPDPIQVPVLGSGFDFNLSAQRPTRPLRSTNTSRPETSTVNVSVSGTEGTVVRLECAAANLQTKCLVSPSTVVLGKEESEVSLAVSQVQQRVRRLRPTNNGIPVGTVTVSATANGETKRSTYNF
jgi:hypothetical protein